MSWLKTLATRKLTSDRFDRRIGQWCAFAMAPGLFYFGVLAVCRNSTTVAELTIGLLATISVAFLAIVIGLLLPLASPAWRKNIAKRQTSLDSSIESPA